MKNKILCIVCSLFILSIVFNFYFLSGESITIHQDKRIINYDKHYHNQFRGNMHIYQWQVKGDEIRWFSKRFENIETTLVFLEKLHPISSFYCKISQHVGYYTLFYPTIVEVIEVKYIKKRKIKKRRRKKIKKR